MQAHAPGPASEVARGECVIAVLHCALQGDRGTALECGADQERGREEGEGEDDPALAEPPAAVAVEHEADAEADDGDRRRREDQRADPRQARAETRDGVVVAAAERVRREDDQENQSADPDHRGQHVQEQQPLVDARGGEGHAASLVSTTG